MGKIAQLSFEARGKTAYLARYLLVEVGDATQLFANSVRFDLFIWYAVRDTYVGREFVLH